MYINPKLISEDKNKEGVYHKSSKGAIYMFFNQLCGEKLRLDIYNGKKISDVEEFKNYNIISCSDKYNPKSKVTTYYLSPKKKYYTDTTGITYKTSSIYVYVDRNGDYRSFADDTKKDIDNVICSIRFYKDRLKRAEKSQLECLRADVGYLKKCIEQEEKELKRLNKILSRGGI